MFVCDSKLSALCSQVLPYTCTHARKQVNKQSHICTYSYIEHIVSYKRRDTITVSSGKKKKKKTQKTKDWRCLLFCRIAAAALLGGTNGQIVNEWETWLSNITFIITIGIPTIRSWNELEFAISTLTGLFCLNPWHTRQGFNQHQDPIENLVRSLVYN